MGVETSAKIERVDRAEDGSVTVETGKGRFIFDDLLVAAGRTAQIPDGLAELGVERDRRGFISISPCGKTNVDGIWAAGDVTGKYQFTHYASYQRTTSPSTSNTTSAIRSRTRSSRGRSSPSLRLATRRDGATGT